MHLAMMLGRRFVVTVLFMALVPGLSGCGRRGHENSGALEELRWFQCVADARSVERMPGLRKSAQGECYGVGIRVPAGFHTEGSRRESARGLNPYGGLRVDVPRAFIGSQQVPRVPTALEFVRVKFKPIHRATPFFNGEYEPSSSGGMSRTQIDMVSLRGFWKIQDTRIEENGFRVFETPRAQQRANYGMRVYAPTAAHPEILAACKILVVDNRGRQWAPTCRVFTTYGGLFELEYRILHADIRNVRTFDAAFKRMLGEWIE